MKIHNLDVTSSVRSTNAGEKKIKKSFGDFAFHPVTFAMVSLYVSQMAHKAFFDEGRHGD